MNCKREYSIFTICLLVLGAILTGAATVSQAATPSGPAGKIYVANQASDSVTVIDARTFEVLAEIGVGDRPHNVNHTPDGRFVLVTNKNLDLPQAPSLSQIRSDIDEVAATVEGIGSRIEHVVAPVQGRAYVSEDLGENAVVEIDLESRAATRKVAVGVKPHGLWPTPDGRYLFVPNQLSGTVSKVDVEKMAVVAEARVGHTPTMVALSPDGASAYVTLFGERALAVLDARNAQSGKMQVNDLIPVGAKPAQVAVTPDGRYVLVPCEGPGALYVVSTHTHEVAAVIPTGGRAHGVDVSSDGRHAFVSNWADNNLSVIDLEAMMVIAQVPVGEEPAGVDFLPPP